MVTQVRRHCMLFLARHAVLTLRYLEMPLMVPPVPAAQTKPSILPPVCSQISGPAASKDKYHVAW